MTTFLMQWLCLHKKYLLWNLVSRNLKVKYRKSTLGFLWTLLVPGALAATYYFVFRIVLKVEIPNYVAFVVSGILPWTFVSQSIAESTDCIVNNFGLLSKVPIPIQIFPLSGVLTNFINLILATPVLIVVIMLSDISFHWSYLAIIPIFIALFVIAYSFSLLFSVAYVFFRDLKHIINIGLQIWFYATPVLYSVNLIPEQYRWGLYVNPVGAAFAELHGILISNHSLALSNWIAILTWTLLSASLSLLVLWKTRDSVVENI